MEGMHVQGVRVLVAEDNLINQMVAKKMLTALGATVSVVSNGQEAVNSVCADLGPKSDDTTFDASQTDSSQNRETDSESNGYAFDVVLMDMAMPQMDGLQVTLTPRQPVLSCFTPVDLDEDHCTRCNCSKPSVHIILYFFCCCVPTI